jgi:hypothetical protein
MSKLRNRLLGAAGGALALPIMADMARGVSFITEPMSGSDVTGFATRYIPGLQMYADAGNALNKLTGAPAGLGAGLTSIGLSAAGSELAARALSRNASEAVASQIANQVARRASNVDIPMLLAAMAGGAGIGAIGHKMLSKESAAKYYYSLK